MREAADAFRAASKRHPPVNFDRCTTKTPITDKRCGSALTTASKVAAVLRAELGTTAATAVTA
ncbi:hypothetical protein [Nonomuraea sp. NPDC049400]|uniref:hypothetical protein n=1 Tax=Nonomuraea sp. NPDC049400 TaxID=3364352 RepID=UPI0037B8845E